MMKPKFDLRSLPNRAYYDEVETKTADTLVALALEEGFEFRGIPDALHETAERERERLLAMNSRGEDYNAAVLAYMTLRLAEIGFARVMEIIADRIEAAQGKANQ